MTPELRDPRTAYRAEGFPEDDIAAPGVTSELRPQPEHGEDGYRGSGRLTGRRALITGGDSGIGRAVAIAYAREGADVAIAYLPEEQEDAETSGALIESTGRKALLLPGDLRDEQHCAAIVQDTVASFGGLDLLVLNAGYQHAIRGGLGALDTAELERVVRTNLFGLLWTARAAVPVLPAGSSIIVTSSVQAASPSAELIDYAMTKAAQVAFVKALAEELGPEGIRVNAVAPGPVWTPLIPATGWPDKLPSFGQDTALGRAGQPAELAGAYVFLAEEASSFVSGAVLPVTGGTPF